MEAKAIPDREEGRIRCGTYMNRRPPDITESSAGGCRPVFICAADIGCEVIVLHGGTHE
jgi:hypothetical protein